MPIWQLCANLLIPNCLRSNLSYSPLAALELYVNKSNSTLRKTLGSLFGYQKIPRDKNYQINKKTKFGAEDENSLTAWMERNLLFAYLANDKKDELESFLIDSLLPPLNVEGSKAATLQRVHELRCDK